RRIKPDYTTTAFLYDVRATIDVEADVDSDGRILSTRIVRWAGFGLEDSVEKAIRSMNWRPAMRGGKPLPMRVLLRYNFTKVDKE
ncbi:MAG: energy transducer TonB, partial [Acidobacteriota bacterium]